MFNIVITRTTLEKRPAGKEWEPTGHMHDCGSPGCKRMAYTPEIDKITEIECKLYEQSIENLNLEAVILAVNGMPHHYCAGVK